MRYACSIAFMVSKSIILKIKGPFFDYVSIKLVYGLKYCLILSQNAKNWCGNPAKSSFRVCFAVIKGKNTNKCNVQAKTSITKFTQFGHR